MSVIAKNHPRAGGFFLTSTMSMTHSVVLPADKFVQHNARQYLQQHFAQLPPVLLNDIALALAEALQNIVRHGYQFSADATVTLQFSTQAHTLTIDIVDHAPPCQPETFLHQPHTPSEQGKMGLNIIKKLTRHFSITPLAHGNRTRLVFDLNRHDPV